MKLKKITDKLNEIEKAPLKCNLCGKKETMYNMAYEYSNGKIVCNQCAMKQLL